MNKKFEFQSNFIKNRDNLEMLKRSLESGEIDKDIVPILEKFFYLPITPRESCYGHPEKGSSPYLSYVDDDTQNEQDKNFQRLFREKIKELTTKIHERIGNESVNIVLEEIDRGGGPKDYTLKFEIADKVSFLKNGETILDAIWGEFSKYIGNLK